MMNLDKFREYLRRIDEATCGHESAMFDCRATELGADRFSYDFDGYIPVTVEFHADGSMSSECEGYTHRYDSVAGWIGAQIDMMTIPPI
jgi:hypothetical protein